MKFRLEWKQTATDELAAIWVIADSPTRHRITIAANEVDYLLRSDPYQHSESRDADRRILFVAPLAITFRVDESASEVEILRVRKFS